jgi:tyrosine-protein kinase Etk/Wzc
MNKGVFGTPADIRRNDGESFSAVELSQLLVDNLWLIVSIALITTALATIYAFAATPYYSADASVKVDFPQPNSIGDSSRVPDRVIPTTLPTDAEIQIIQSRSVIAPVIDKFRQDVLVTPKMVPVIGAISRQFATPGEPMGAPFGLGSFAWGGEEVSVGSLTVPDWLQDQTMVLTALDGGHYKLVGPSGEPLLTGTVGTPAQANGISMTVDKMAARPGTDFKVVRMSEVKAVSRFLHQLKVSEAGKETGVVEIVYENTDPVLAKQIANGIATAYIASHIAQRRSEALNTREFVIGELPQLHANLLKAEAELSKFRAESSSMQAGSEASSYLQGSIEFDRQIALLKVQKAGLENHFRPDSRDVVTINNQLEQLQDAKRAFEARFEQLPASERRSADLTRNVKVAESIYVAMVNKSNELAVTQAGTLGNVHIIDTAVMPVEPVHPKKLLVICLGAVGGFIVAFLYVFMRRLWSTSLDNSLVAERHLNLPVFGSVLFSDEQARLNRVQASNWQNVRSRLLTKSQHSPDEAAASSPNSAFGNGPLPDHTPDASRFLLATDGNDEIPLEGLRSTWASLQRQLHHAANNVLVVTGATPGTGKSFVSSNLAVLCAETGKRVLLIDGDMRRGHLAATMKQGETVGLADVLAEQVDISRAIRGTDVPGLSFLGAGHYPSNPSQLLSKPRMHQLLDRLSEAFDMVIIDTPPVLAVSDANLIASFAGSTVLVIRPNAQNERELEETTQRLALAGANVIGTILNAIPRRRSDKRAHSYAAMYSARANSQF